jgi:hypothetical protein
MDSPHDPAPIRHHPQGQPHDGAPQLHGHHHAHRDHTPGLLSQRQLTQLHTADGQHILRTPLFTSQPRILTGINNMQNQSQFIKDAHHQLESNQQNDQISDFQIPTHSSNK